MDESANTRTQRRTENRSERRERQSDGKDNGGDLLDHLNNAFKGFFNFFKKELGSARVGVNAVRVGTHNVTLRVLNPLTFKKRKDSLFHVGVIFEKLGGNNQLARLKMSDHVIAITAHGRHLLSQGWKLSDAFVAELFDTVAAVAVVVIFAVSRLNLGVVHYETADTAVRDSEFFRFFGFCCHYPAPPVIPCGIVTLIIVLLFSPPVHGEPHFGHVPPG